MQDFRFRLDPSFYERLRSRLEAKRLEENAFFSRVHQHSPFYFVPGSFLRREFYPPETVPTQEQLTTLVETAFWASLRREEGRTLRFTLAYNQRPSSHLFSLVLSEPVPFDTAHLVKIAPASGNASIGVTSSPQSGRLEICELTESPLSPVRVKALDPGQLIVSFSGKNIAVISGDQPTFIKNELLNLSSNLWRVFAEDSTDMEVFARGMEHFALGDERVSAVLTVARQMRLMGHGGTLIVVPDRQSWERSKDSVSYPAAVQNRITSEFLEYLAEAKRDLEEDKTNKTAAEQVKLWQDAINTSAMFIAPLTAVDGATVITPELEVVGFGVKLKAASDAAFEYVVRLDPLDHDKWLEKISVDSMAKGTRHKSAARFVFDNRGSLAIVASQDGNVTAYVWDDAQSTPSFSGVQSYERLELTLF